MKHRTYKSFVNPKLRTRRNIPAGSRSTELLGMLNVVYLLA
jgi:hypothetical protein